jgi:hypothetical protein
MMSTPTIHVAIRSYKRAGTITTLKLFPEASVWVPESQARAYRQEYGAKRIEVVPDAEDGNLARKCNAILERSPSRWTLIVDDDLTSINMWEGGAKHVLTMRQIRGMVEHFYDLAEQLRVTLWGLNQIDDALAYRTQTPFSFLAPVLGPFAGHLDPVVRYDPSVGGKDDYDFWLATIAREHRTLRVNKYTYRHDSGRKAGGFVSLRTLEIEQASVARMRAKWGNLFRAGGSIGPHSRGTNILNSIVTVPIAGV